MTSCDCDPLSLLLTVHYIPVNQPSSVEEFVVSEAVGYISDPELAVGNYGFKHRAFAPISPWSKLQ
jgi:hypothetical protein